MYKRKTEHDDCCECVGFDEIIRPASLAVAYIPKQIVCKLYSPCEALAAGTAFPELDKPYVMPFGMARPKKMDCREKKGGMKNECRCR